MKNFLLLVLFIFPCFSNSTSLLVSKIIKKPNSCDYFIAYNELGYVVAEFNSGREFEIGDVILGNINKYGNVTIYDSELEESADIYVEDYQLKKDEALDLLIEECD